MDILSWGQTLPSKMDPILVSIGPLTIYWYSTMYLVAFGVVYLLCSQQIKNTASAVKNLTTRAIADPEDVIQEGYEAAALGMANRGISKEELAGGWKTVRTL